MSQLKIFFMLLFISGLACNSGDKKKVDKSQAVIEKYDTVYLNIIDTVSANLVVDKQLIRYNHSQLFSLRKDHALQLIPLNNKIDTQILIIKMTGEYEYKAQLVKKNLLTIDKFRWQPENLQNTHILVISRNSNN